MTHLSDEALMRREISLYQSLYDIKFDIIPANNCYKILFDGAELCESFRTTSDAKNYMYNLNREAINNKPPIFFNAEKPIDIRSQVNVEPNRNRMTIYIIGIIGCNKYKIGITSKSPEERMKSLQTGSPFKLYLIHSFITDLGYSAESDLHEKYKNKRIKGSEWFDLEERDLDYIKTFGGQL